MFHRLELATGLALHVDPDFAPTLDAPLDKKSFRLVIFPFHYRCLSSDRHHRAIDYDIDSSHHN